MALDVAFFAMVYREAFAETPMGPVVYGRMVLKPIF
jgi:hypothetical protein